ncbi:MAG: MATE family efflux transporter, partial [Proteobacteria bacterium]|nr:MATE family efflux transporter [Pseudomonadota bacterium]
MAAAARTAPDLLRDPIPGLILRIGLPVSVGFFFNTMFNVTDTYFAGKLSTEALAALSLSFPLFFLIISFASGISTGTTALIGAALGANDQKNAIRYSVQGLLFGLLVSLFIAWVGLRITPFMYGLLGAEGFELAAGLRYMGTIFLGSTAFLIVQMFNAILTAQGKTHLFRNFLVAGFVLNLVLDPWFIYGGFGLPALGVRGVALATVLVQCLGCLYLCREATKTGLLNLSSPRQLLPDWHAFLDIARQGIPAAVNFMTIAMGVFVILYFVGMFGTGAKAAYGAAMRVEQMVLVPTIGLNVAVLTIVAQNFGANNFSRIRETLATAFKFGAWIMGAGTLVVFFLAPQVMNLFSSDPEVIQLGADYLHVDAFVLYAYVILFVST